jgi:hypothetical protein
VPASPAATVDRIRTAVCRINSQAVIGNDATTQHWPNYNLDYLQTGFSKFKQSIQTQRVNHLARAVWVWSGHMI